MKTWYIEDAGGGCRAFSEVVVLVCEETGENFSARVPLSWDNGESLEEIACRLTVDMMNRAGIKESNPLLVCSGNIFHGLHRWLGENGYNWQFAHMEGLAHDTAEEEFQNQIIEAGFPAHIKLIERNYRQFYRLLENWVMEDSSRHCYLKDKEKRQKPVEARFTLRANNDKAKKCFSCGKKIKPYTGLVEYKAKQDGKRIRRYFHPDCSPVEPMKNKLVNATVTFEGKALTGILTPCKSQSPCHFCGKEITPGEISFFGYTDSGLVSGHSSCEESEKTTP